MAEALKDAIDEAQEAKLEVGERKLLANGFEKKVEKEPVHHVACVHQQEEKDCPITGVHVSPPKSGRPEPRRGWGSN